MLNWNFKPYSELSLNEFHDAIALRMKVFIIEQNCTYQDLDGLDKECYHLLTTNQKNEVVGTARIIPPGILYPAAGIGRVVLDESVRGENHGHELMRQCMKFISTICTTNEIELSAQKHLEQYYNKHGFISTGHEYEEDGIPHVKMIHTLK